MQEIIIFEDYVYLENKFITILVPSILQYYLLHIEEDNIYLHYLCSVLFHIDKLYCLHMRIDIDKVLVLAWKVLIFLHNTILVLYNFHIYILLQHNNSQVYFLMQEHRNQCKMAYNILQCHYEQAFGQKLNERKK